MWRIVLWVIFWAAAAASAAEADGWRCLLKRTTLDEGALRSTLYVAELVAGEISTLATFEDVDVAAAAADAGGETVLVAGYPYGVPGRVVRIYRVDVASGDYVAVGDFEYSQLPEVSVAYDEGGAVFYLAVWGNLDPVRGPERFLMPATYFYRYDPAQAVMKTLGGYRREYALVGAGAGALYVITYGYVNSDLDWGEIFVYLDAESGDVHYTDFGEGEVAWDNRYDDKAAEDKGLWGDFFRERSWFTGPARYPPDGIRPRPIYYYSYDPPPLSEYVEIYVNGPADGDAYRTLKADWRARDVFYSYRRDAAVYLIPGETGAPTDVVVTSGDGTPGPRLALPAYEPRGAVKIVELGYELSFDYSLLYVE